MLKDNKNKKLYDFDVENSKKKKRKKQNKEQQKVKSNQFDPDKEIIIGVTKLPDKNNKKVKEKTIKQKKRIKDNNEEKLKKEKNTAKKKTQKKKTKNSKNVTRIIKWTSLIIIVIATAVFALVSPIFNIIDIEVTGNKSVSTEKIIGLSGINIGENVFKINKRNVVKEIKNDGYIENVNIYRILPNKIKIEIEERTPTFLIENGNGYTYINNQGYILEVSNEKIDLPIIIGVSTPIENMTEASRLCDEDLNKLSTVLKIVDIAEVNNIKSIITTIDIIDKDNYKMYFESEQKTAYLGDCSNLETRMLYLTAILKNETGIAGEIFVDMNLNTDDAFFRESVR